MMKFLNRDVRYLWNIFGLKFGEIDFTDFFRFGCEICGFETNGRIPGGGMCPWLLGPIFDKGDLVSISYGIAKKSFWCCRKHKDAEIKKKVKELI